jgi:hypothetical protein
MKKFEMLQVQRTPSQANVALTCMPDTDPSFFGGER